MRDDEYKETGNEFVGLLDMAASLCLVFLLVSSVAVAMLLDRNEELSKALATQGQVTNKPQHPKELRIIIPNELNGRVFFDTGESTIRPEFFPVIDSLSTRISDELKNGSFTRVQIEGHTDDRPLRSNVCASDNWDLGADRAITVLRYLVETGIPPDKLSIVSYGQYRPSRPGASETVRAANRRIEVVLLRDEGNKELP